MAMFDDPKKELKKLEQQLLKDEEWLDRELAAARALMGDEPVKKSAKTAPARKNMEQTQVYRTAGASRPGGEAAPVRNYANNYGRTPKVVVRNPEDYDLDEYEAKHPKKGVKGLVILAVLETLGIVAVVAYWLRFLL